MRKKLHCSRIFSKDTAERRTRRQTVMTSKSRYFIEASASMIARFARGNVCERIVDHLSPHPLLGNSRIRVRRTEPECQLLRLRGCKRAGQRQYMLARGDLTRDIYSSSLKIVGKKLKIDGTLINRSTEPQVSIIDFCIAYVPSALAS